MGCLAVHETTVVSLWLLECFKTQKEALSTRWSAQSGGKSGSIWSLSHREVLHKGKWIGQSGFKMQLIVKIVSIIYQNDLFAAG
jgi:hypothetical protein